MIEEIVKKKILIPLYHAIWPLAVSWTIFTFISSLFTRYDKCIFSIHAEAWLLKIGLAALAVFLFIAITIIIFTINEVLILRKDKEENEENKLKNLSILEGSNRSSSLVVCKNYVNIFPLYLIGWYSFSRLVILIAVGNKKFHGFNNLSLFVWAALFLFSWYFWFKLKKYANKENTYSIAYALFIILFTWLSLHWETLIPYINELINLFKCIAKQYISENSTSFVGRI